MIALDGEERRPLTAYLWRNGCMPSLIKGRIHSGSPVSHISILERKPGFYSVDHGYECM